MSGLLLPEFEVPSATSSSKLREACCQVVNMIEDINQISSAYDIMSRTTSRLVALLRPLLSPTLALFPLD